jgi:histidine decarboxylase
VTEEVSHPFKHAIDSAPVTTAPVVIDDILLHLTSANTSVPRGCPDSTSDRLASVHARLRTAHANHLGYPYNLVGQSATPPQFADYLINNLGDPYVGSHYASEVCDLEREAVGWLMDLWQCPSHDDFWGSVGASGTEGNLWALYLGREAFPDAVLLHSTEAHYSIPKAARILRMGAEAIASDTSGQIDIAALRTTLATLDAPSVVVALTCGTTVKGAHDDIAAVVAALDAAGYGPDRRFIHVDGALNAMVLPFVEGAPACLQPSFRHAIDSISTSGHKMIGTTMPCGVLITRREAVDRVASAIAYLRSNDTTLMGSRNGHAVMALWSRFTGHGIDGFRRDVRRCLERVAMLADALRSEGVPVLLNPHSLTALFPQPDEAIVRRYQLACRDGEAHAIVMPNVGEALIERFLQDYLQWWRRTAQPGVPYRGIAGLSAATA